MKKKELPKAYEASQYEDEIYQSWEEGGYFNPDNLDLAKDAENYSIVLPPPNVTGNLHMGHAGMLAYEDILIRYHRMKGDRALWVPGTDHAAIATQTKVEKIIKEEGTNRHKMGREKFLERVRQFAQDSHDTIVGQCKKMGASLDWSREAYTLDEARTKAVRSVFKMMYDDGLIYRGERIVNWCPRCHSTLADDEVEYKEQKSKLYTFRYDKNFPIAIATTRPETKLGDTAVAVNPKDDRYKDYIGKEYQADFCGLSLRIKIIADREVDMEFGTGAIGVTPAHSAIDWMLAEKNNLPVVKVINEDGNIKEGFGKFSGKNVREARKMIVTELKNRLLIEKEEEIENKLSICYRCDAAVEPLPSLQWFVDVNKKISQHGKSIKELSIEAVKKGVLGRDKIRIIPERFEKNYFHWMNNLRDWCISRQIWFGHQVPVWYRSTVNNLQLTIDNKEDFYVGVEAPEGEGWTQDPDTLDTWFSSGLWTFSALVQSPDQIKLENKKLIIDSDDYRNFHPTNVLETGYDILFFWVARMIIMTTYAVGDIPFQDVYLHGLVLDDKGKKMSKSKDNVINPLDMVAQYGADATRLSLVIGSTPGNDLKLNEEKISGYRNMVNKLWNISRYVITNYELRITNEDLDHSKMSDSELWILEELRGVKFEVSQKLENYNFSEAGEMLRKFTYILADNYIEANKFDNSEEKEKVVSIVLKDLLRLWHPFIPFVTEAIWSLLEQEKPLIIESWPKAEKEPFYGNDKATGERVLSFSIILDLISKIRNSRSEHKIEPSKKIKAIFIVPQNKDFILNNAEIIKKLRTGIEDFVVYTKEEFKKETKPDSAIYIIDELIEIYLLGAVDADKEKLRIEKEIEKLEKAISDIEQRLANKEFVERAPKAIVEREQKALTVNQSELLKLKEQLSNF